MLKGWVAMYDILDMFNGETVVEMGSADKVRAFLNDVFPFEDLSGFSLNDLINLAEGYGFKVYQID